MNPGALQVGVPCSSLPCGFFFFSYIHVRDPAYLTVDSANAAAKPAVALSGSPVGVEVGIAGLYDPPRTHTAAFYTN